MELFKLIHGMLDMSGLEWHLGIGSDGIISGYVDGIDFCYNKEFTKVERFISELAEIVIEAILEKKGEEPK